MTQFKEKKVYFLVSVIVYLGSFTYYLTSGFGFFFSAFLAIPTTPFVIIFGGGILEIVGGLLTPLWNWLKR